MSALHKASATGALGLAIVCNRNDKPFLVIVGYRLACGCGWGHNREELYDTYDEAKEDGPKFCRKFRICEWTEEAF